MSKKRTLHSIDDAANSLPSIINLPRSDFQSSSTRECSSNKYPPLLLLQLPSNTSSVQSFLDSKPQIWIQEEDDAVYNDVEEEDETSGIPQDVVPCKLIQQRLGQTFPLTRVETSNAYVLVPPSSGTPQTKRQKAYKDKEDKDLSNYVPVNGRLLRPTNTFFLECTVPSPETLVLRLQTLKRWFQERRYPIHKRGYSMEDLQSGFTCSIQEVESMLSSLGAFCFPGNDTEVATWGELDEEVELQIMSSIVATLSEWEGANEYGTKGLNLNDFVRQVLDRKDTLDYGDLINQPMSKEIVQYCLYKCARNELKQKFSGPLERGVLNFETYLKELIARDGSWYISPLFEKDIPIPLNVNYVSFKFVKFMHFKEKTY
jgi:hypothetical protein